MSLLSIVEIIYYFVVWTQRKPQNVNEVKKKVQIQQPIQKINHIPFLH